MRKLTLIPLLVLAVSCATTGWEKKDKDIITASCTNEIGQLHKEPVPSIFCGCMVDRMEKDVPEVTEEKAKAWLKSTVGQKAGNDCSIATSKKLK